MENPADAGLKSIRRRYGAYTESTLRANACTAWKAYASSVVHCI